MRFNCRFGDITIPDGDDLIASSIRLYGEWAQGELDLLARLIQPGQIVVDAGAYLGSHSRAFSEMVGANGRVHAFEANPAVWPLLQENAALAAQANIAVHCVGVGAHEEHRIGAEAQQQHNLGTVRLGPVARTDADGGFAVARLDAALPGPVDFIKIDVEGMEVDVLEGAQRLIDEARPLVFAELNTIEQGVGLCTWARRNGYEVWGSICDAYNPANFRGETENIFGDSREAGLLMAPAERNPAREAAITALGLPRIGSADDLAMLLLQKPQYPDEVLTKTEVAALLMNAETAGAGITSLHRAKERAEALAVERLEELQRFGSLYAAMEAAKERAERLALDRATEIQRRSAEIQRLSAEIQRLSAEIQRLSAEIQRLSAEVETLAAECGRLSDEALWLRSWRRFLGRRPPHP